MDDSADETVAAGIAAGRSALGGLVNTGWDEVGDKALLEAVAAAQTLATQAHAAALASLAELEKRGLCQVRFGIDTAAWLADQQKIARPTARAEVRTARECFVDTPLLGDALGRGELTVEHARAIGHGLGIVPLTLPAEDEVRLHRTLVGYCAQFTPTEVRRLTNHAVEVIAPDAFDAWQAAVLARQEELARRSRSVSYRWTEHGTLRLVAVLDAADGELVTNALERCTSLATDSGIGETDEHTATVGGVDGAAAGRGDEVGSSAQVLSGARSRVSPLSQRRADALVALAHRALNADPDSPPTATLATALVTFDYATLTGQITSAGTLLGSAEPISPHTCRALACDAGLIPVVLNSLGVPVDRGRETRFFDQHQRMLLALRDRGCAFPGCDRPPIDCRAHHIVPWQCGGLSDLSNGVLVCPFHHRLVEPQPSAPPGTRWEARLDERQLPVFLPPVGYDRDRRPRQHARFIVPPGDSDQPGNSDEPGNSEPPEAS